MTTLLHSEDIWEEVRKLLVTHSARSSELGAGIALIKGLCHTIGWHVEFLNKQ